MISAVLRFFRRGRDAQQGYTLIEVVASVVILGIIMVPLGTAMVFGYRTVFGITERMAQTTDLRVLSTYFPSDVASVDTDGVNPTRVEDQGICKASASEQSLITFRWDKDLGENGQTVVRYLARGTGTSSELIRRACHGSDTPDETVLAQHFGEKGPADAATYLNPTGTPEDQTPACGVRECFIDIHGAYDFHMSAQRRVEGQNGSGTPPGAPVDVHALGGYQRARVFWDPPATDGGQAITGYYIEQSPGGIVGGASTPTLFPATAGNPPGALIDGLSNSQSYTFKVRAVNIHGNGPWSLPSNSVTPAPTTPEPPALGSAAGDPATAGRITANWSLPSDFSDGGATLTGFNLTAVNPDSVPTTVSVTPGSARTGAVTGLENNTRYTVQVSALNTYGEGSPSNSVTGVLTLPGAPGTPAGSSGPSAGAVVLTFTPPSTGLFSDLTAFRARVGTTNQPSVDAATACATSASCSITITGLDVSAANTVTVQAQNATGWGALSGTLTIPADTTAPTVAVTFPAKPQYGPSAWNAGCDNAGGAICGTASDPFPGTVSNVKLTVRRSSDSRYWNGSEGTGTSQWSSSTQTLTATGTTSWSRAITTGSLQNGVTYTISITATDATNHTSTAVVKTFTYLTGAPTASLTAPANGATVRGSVTVSGNAGATSPATVDSAEFQYKKSSASSWTSIGTDTSSPYSVSWDTTTLTEDGSYDLRLIVTDSAGTSTTSSTRTVTVDNLAPTGNITDPVGGSFVRGSVTVKSDSADTGSGVASARFDYKLSSGSTWTTIATDTSSPYQATWNTSALTDGAYDLRVVTTDNGGLAFTSPSVTVTVDNTNPTVGPANVVGTAGTNGWYTSDVTVTWPTPTDPISGIASSTGCGPTTINTNTSGQVVTCSATDGAGNTASSSVTIKRDATAPTGALTAPADGATIAGSVTVSSNSADSTSGVANATFQVSPAGANTWTAIGSPDTSSPYSVSWNTSALVQGSYDLRVVTTDNAGNTFTSPVRTVYVDSTPPTVAITFPAQNGAYNSAGWTAGCSSAGICGTAADTAPGTVDDVTVTVRRSSDNRYWNGSAGTGTSQWSTSVQNLSTTGTTSWSRALTTASLQNGVTYTVVATATDAVGLTGTDTHSFVYDTTNPTGTITNPSDSDNISGTVSVTSNSADTGGAGIVATVYEFRSGTSGAWTAIGTDIVGPPWGVSWNTTAVTDGQYYLRVTTTDAAGNSFSSLDTAVRVRVDNTAPTGSITAPAAGATVGGSSVTVSSNSADSGSGVASATFQSSPAGQNTWTTIATDSSSPYSVTWDTTSLTQGSYDLRVVTTDNAGMSFTSPTRTVFVDSIAPTVTIGFPADDGAYNAAGWTAGCAATGVCGTAADTAPGTVSSVTFTVRRSSDSRYWNGTAGTSNSVWLTTPTNLTVTGTTSWTRALTTTSLQNGVTYTVVATATDAVGLTGTDTNAFVYDTTTPTGAITAPANSANVKGTVAVTSNSADTGGAGVASAAFEYSAATTGPWSAIGTDTDGSPWSVNWDTTAVPDGQYYLRVTTTDAAGNSFTSSVSAVRVRIDNTLPTGDLTAPADGAFVKGTSVAVSSNSADTGGSGVASATFQRSPAGANSWTTIGSPDTSSPYSVTWNTTSGTPDGDYDLRVVTTDVVGNTFTSPMRTVTVDNALPSIVGNAAGTQGNNGWYVSNVTLTWTVTDATSGIATTTNCGPQSITADTTASGTTFTCSATDNAGNSASGSVTIKRDATAPTGSLTAPADAAYVKGSVTVSSNSADSLAGVTNATFQRSVSGANSWTTIGSPDTSSPYSVAWDTTAVSDNEYDLRVITTDNAGNTFTSPTRTVTVDNTKPLPTNVTLNNASGQTLGQVSNGDYVDITYSEALNVSTICSAWSGTGDKTLSNTTVTLSTADVLTFSNSSCTAGLDIGSVNTAGNYNSSSSQSRTYSASTVTWSAATRVLRITLGTGSGGTVGTVSTAGKPIYTPDTSLADLAGNTMNATAFTAPTASRF